MTDQKGISVRQPEEQSLAEDRIGTVTDASFPASEVGEDVKNIAIDTINAEGQYTQQQYTRMLRKIDRYLLPLMWVSYHQPF